MKASCLVFEVHKLVGFTLEVLISNEDRIIRVDVRYTIGKLLLQLSSQIADDASVYPAAKQLVLVLFPVVQLNQLNHPLCELEELVFRVGRDDDHETQRTQHTPGQLFQPGKVVVEVFIKRRKHCFEKGVSFTNESVQESGFGSQQEELHLLVTFFEGRYRNVSISDAGLDKSLSLLCMLAL